MQRRNLALWTMTALSFGTGVLDAATYLRMDDVFGANMTGNVILIALSIAGEGVGSFVGPLMALGGFITGSWILGLIARRVPKASSSDPIVAPDFAVCAIGMVTITAVPLWLPMTGTLLHAATFSIGFLMGFQALAARRVGVPDISTVVITSTMSLLFSEAGQFHGGASRIATGRRAVAVLSVFLGAVSGALLLKISLVAALVLPTIVLTVVALIYTTKALVFTKRLSQDTQTNEFVNV